MSAILQEKLSRLQRVLGYYILSRDEDEGFGFNPEASSDLQFAILSLSQDDQNGEIQYAFSNMPLVEWSTSPQFYLKFVPPTSEYSPLFNLVKPVEENEQYYQIITNYGSYTDVSFYNDAHEVCSAYKSLIDSGLFHTTVTKITEDEYAKHSSKDNE